MMSPLLAPALLTLQEETRVRGGTTLSQSSSEPSEEPHRQSPGAQRHGKGTIGYRFRALDDSISNLEKRLSMRIDSDYSWDWFAADNNSMLVSRFTRVFIEGSSSTGEAGLVGDMVSQSTTSLLGLRQRRQISANVMRSVSYGLLIAMIIALNITTSIIAGLGETIASVAQGLVDGAGEVGTATGGVDVALPALAETGGIEQNIRVFQYMGSFLIVISIVILGLITARIRGAVLRWSLDR